jgi:hypothetical protein
VLEEQCSLSLEHHFGVSPISRTYMYALVKDTYACMSSYEYNKYDAHVCYDILRHVYDSTKYMVLGVCNIALLCYRYALTDTSSQLTDAP